MPSENLPEPPNPSGLCMCGCGGLAPIAKVTIRRYGHLRGHPLRFIRGHANKTGVERRFWAKVEKGEGCWVWHGLQNATGYGVSNGTLAHRLAYEFANGPIPEGLFVCHRCDNPPCCNPAHLWTGTNADNIADRMAKKRPGGGKRTLTEADVRVIREWYPAGWFQRDLAEAFGVAQATISKIIRRERWRHI